MEAGVPSNRQLLIEDEFYVGPWHVQPRLNMIKGPDAAVQVEPRIMEVLVCLAAQPGAVVTRAQLHKQVWPDMVVTDKALTRTISVLRKVFDDNPRNPQVIATISKTGYRLIAPVAYGTSDPGSVHETASAETTSPMLPPTRRWTNIYLWGATALLIVLSSGLTWFFLTPEPTLPLTPATPFTTFTGDEISPQLSPDGKAVAFAWKGPSEDQWDIYVKQQGMEQPLRLTDHAAADVHPFWSPDGTLVAFIRHEGDHCTIFAVPALSGSERKLAPCWGGPARGRVPFTFKASWSPDSKTLALEDTPSGHDPTSIYLLDLETQARTKLTDPARSYLGDTDPVFSPDGRLLSFIRYRDWGQADLFVVPFQGGEARQVTFTHRPILGHGWTNDGQRLLFSSNRTGTYQLWEIPATGGDPRWRPLIGWNLEAFSIARQSQRLVYENWLYDVNIWRMSLGAAYVSRQHVASSMGEVDPAYAQDGHIAFVSNRSGAYEVWKSRPDGSEPIQLTRFNGPMVRAPRWSPDGTRLVFEMREHEQADLYVVDAAGEPARRLTQDPADEVTPAWSPDGKWLYFGANRAGTWQIWKMPVEGGPATPITIGEGYAPQVAPDGTSIYYAKSDAPGIWHVPAEGGPETLVVETLATGDWGNWSLSKQGLYFVRRSPTDQRAFLAFYDFTTQTSRDLTVFERPPLRFQKGLSLSANGQWLLHTQLDQTQSDLMLVDSFR